MSTISLTPARTNVAARLGIVGVGSFFAISVLAATLTPGYRSSRDAISGLAAMDKPHAALMIAGFLLAASGLVATGVGLAKRFGGTLSGRIAAGLVLVSGGLMAAAGLARQDCTESLPTCVDHGEAPLASTSFWVHQYVSLALFLTLVIAAFVLVRAVRRTEGFGFLKVPARIVAYTSLILTVAAMTVGFGDLSGLMQRPYLALLFGWPILLATIAPRTN